MGSITSVGKWESIFEVVHMELITSFYSHYPYMYVPTDSHQIPTPLKMLKLIPTPHILSGNLRISHRYGSWAK